MKLIGWKLSFHFRLKQVLKEDLLNSLVAKHDKQTLCIYFDDLRDTLAHMPFSISDKTELDMLTRYLIEDEDEEDEADENSKQSISIVKSIFNKLLGSYEGKTEREYNFVNNSVLHLIDKRKLTVEVALDELIEPVQMSGVEKFFARFVGLIDQEHQVAEL